MCRASFAGEPGGGEQCEDVFEGAQHSRRPLPERGGQRSGDQQRYHVGVGQGQVAEVAGDGAQLAGPVRVCGVHRELREDDLGDAVEHGGLVGDVAVEHHRIAAQCDAEAAHGQSVHPVAVDDGQRGLQDHRPGELTVVTARSRHRVTSSAARVGPGRLSGHRRTSPLPRSSKRPAMARSTASINGVGQHCVHSVDTSA